MKVAARWVAVLVMLGGLASGEHLSKLSFVVLKDYNGKPIRNASVIMHPVKGNGQQAKTGLELKTDAEGNTSFDGVPYGKLRVQVIAHGYQTFGDDYSIDKGEMEIVVKMKRPGEQYSIYKDHTEDKKPEEKKPEEKKPEEKKPEDQKNR
jgi:hypothetical protein